MTVLYFIPLLQISHLPQTSSLSADDLTFNFISRGETIKSFPLKYFWGTLILQFYLLKDVFQVSPKTQTSLHTHRIALTLHHRKQNKTFLWCNILSFSVSLHRIIFKVFKKNPNSVFTFHFLSNRFSIVRAPSKLFLSIEEWHSCCFSDTQQGYSKFCVYH